MGLFWLRIATLLYGVGLLHVMAVLLRGQVRVSQACAIRLSGWRGASLRRHRRDVPGDRPFAG